MPRPTSFTPQQLTDRALHHFWAHGFHASSMDDLVAATNVSRHGIYSAFGGKRALFLACFDHYQNTIVTPAFKSVESPGATLQTVADYYEHHIAAGETAGFPGSGCFVANSSTEVAPDDPDVMHYVTAHNDRLLRGFAQVLRNECPTHSPETARALANVMVIFTNGLWTQSRSAPNGDGLRQAVQEFLTLLRTKRP